MSQQSAKLSIDATSQLLMPSSSARTHAMRSTALLQRWPKLNPRPHETCSFPKRLTILAIVSVAVLNLLMCQKMFNRWSKPKTTGMGILQSHSYIHLHADSKNLCSESHQTVPQNDFILIFLRKVGEPHQEFRIITKRTWTSTIPTPSPTPTITRCAQPDIVNHAQLKQPKYFLLHQCRG